MDNSDQVQLSSMAMPRRRLHKNNDKSTKNLVAVPILMPRSDGTGWNTLHQQWMQNLQVSSTYLVLLTTRWNIPRSVLGMVLILFFLMSTQAQAAENLTAAVDEETSVVTKYECRTSGVTNLERSLTLVLAEDGVGWLLQQEEALIQEMSQVFQDTYNNQSFQSCDVPSFRTILSATIEKKLDKDPMGDYNGSILKMSVAAQCNNCTSSMTLFPSYKNITIIDGVANGTNTHGLYLAHKL